MIDLVTVVFQDELPVVQVQAQSLQRYCDAEQLGKIIVIVNDDKNELNRLTGINKQYIIL
jgi:hypothetical protein